MENTAIISGLVHVVTPTEHIGDRGFKKRQVVLVDDRNETYPKHIPITFIRGMCEDVDDVSPGDEVKIKYELGGRQWQDRYFLDATATGFRILARNEFHEDEKLSPPADVPF